MIKNNSIAGARFAEIVSTSAKDVERFASNVHPGEATGPALLTFDRPTAEAVMAQLTESARARFKILEVPRNGSTPVYHLMPIELAAAQGTDSFSW